MSQPDTSSPEFLRFYAATLFREYRIRKRGPLGKRAWGHLLQWARKASQQARQKPAQGDLFGGRP